MTIHSCESGAIIWEEQPLDAEADIRRGSLMFLAAERLIGNLKDELQQSPAYTRALTERHFASTAGIPNDYSRQTHFSQNGFKCAVGYEYHFDGPGETHELLEAVKKGWVREERLFLETCSYLRKPAEDSKDNKIA